MGFQKYGDWVRAGVALKALCVNIYPAFTAQLQEDSDLVLKTMVGHIDAQDLSWVPLSKKTIELKGGNETIYVETGWLRDNLSVRRVKSSSKDFTIFIGASPWKRTLDGVKFSDLMIWLEYGTDKMPPRPLIRPTWEEVKPIIQNNWRDVLDSLVTTGGKL